MENQNHAAADAAPAKPERRFPPGYRFVPTDEELITEYLEKKINGQPIPVNKMHEVVLYDYCPTYLTGKFEELGDKEWYFFTPRDRKYPNGTRPKRSVDEVGFWKATGADKKIHSSSTGVCIGKKKVLVFHNGKPKSKEGKTKEEKTNWIMHEYKLNAPSISPASNGDMKLDDCVLCRIKSKYQKPVANPPVGRGNVVVGSSHDETRDFENGDLAGVDGYHGNRIMSLAPQPDENNGIGMGGNQEPTGNGSSHQFPEVNGDHCIRRNQETAPIYSLSYRYPGAGYFAGVNENRGNRIMAPQVAENNRNAIFVNQEPPTTDSSRQGVDEYNRINIPGNQELPQIGCQNDHNTGFDDLLNVDQLLSPLQPHGFDDLLNVDQLLSPLQPHCPPSDGFGDFDSSFSDDFELYVRNTTSP